MISMKLIEIAESLNGEFNGSDRIIKGVSIDTYCLPEHVILSTPSMHVEESASENS